MTGWRNSAEVARDRSAARGRRGAFRAWFAISEADARFLDHLYLAAGVIAGQRELAEGLARTPTQLRASAHKLHQAMDPGSVVVKRGAGWRLTETGLADCRRAISDAARDREEPKKLPRQAA